MVRASASAPKRDTSERRSRISVLVREQGSVQVTDLAARFGVSVQTIRKDLKYLSALGVMARAYGGGIQASPSGIAHEPSVAAKLASMRPEKERIGRFAASLVQPGDSIVLDSGTTTLQIAHHLPDRDDITVVTNDFGVLAALTHKRHIKTVVIGGELRRKNMAFYGAQTVQAMEGLLVHKLFLGVDGLDLEHGITTHHEAEAVLNRKMVAIAREVIAVTDSSKVGRVCLHRIVALEELDALITDGAVPDHITDAASRLHFDLYRV